MLSSKNTPLFRVAHLFPLMERFFSFLRIIPLFSKMHIILVCLAFPVLLLAIPSWGTITANNQEPIRIGAIFSESGIAAPHNHPLIEMTQLAIRELNDKGGLLGRPVQLIQYDNLSTPIGSAMAAQKAIEDNVTAVIGAHWSSHSLAMAPILQAAGIPMISPGSTNPEVTKGKNYIFRACFIDSFQGLAMAKFSFNELKSHTAVVVTNIDEDYSLNLALFFSRAFEKEGGRILAEISYRGNATDFSTKIDEIRYLKPDVIYIPGYTRDSGLFIKQAVNMGINTTFLGGDAWDEIEKYAQRAVDGSFQSAPWHPEVPFLKSELMKDSFFAVYGKDINNTSSPLAYDAVMILADAITWAGTSDRKAVRDALAETTNFHGATGKITFDSNGDPFNKNIIIIAYRGGKRIFEKAIIP